MNDKQMIQMIVDRVPIAFMTEPAKEFAMALLIENVKLLKELKHE